ncbi:TOG array regulator of axonemal microtubules protein 1 [Eurytemora carolleeae]|uniref:TOG array regulator of axonemal microtubules protein 1 n=1 Tax=Eurytemora carolleeae TaxID=1294199 RepID=UPI000C785BD2|nr:TOG array regulator of axonemal microtubules protein 1 [Eurytemora carolleeae]|eukprot:XP_023349071.1 TOG array regulator of axonemal microtubules protein 1-like [Eurytemora affinis]
MAQITKLENQFKLRQFPSGIPEGLTRCLKLLKSGEWEQEVEGLELLNSLAQQAPQALINEEKQVRNQLLLQIKNLRSQVTRSACQCAATLFLHLGRDMEPDLEKVVRELLVKSSDTNKFIRSDAMIALEVMAENVSVNKAVLTMFNLGRDNKSPVIRTNMTKIIDIVITRLGAERLMGSSEELQEAIFKEGSKLLTDGSLDVRQHAKHMWSEISEHQNTGKLLEKYLEPGELRAVNKVLDGLH